MMSDSVISSNNTNSTVDAAAASSRTFSSTNDRKRSSQDISGEFSPFNGITSGSVPSLLPYAKRQATLKETDPHKIENRLKQIQYGKNTKGYDNYTSSVPKTDRGRDYVEHPRTPNAYEKSSKRGFDGIVQAWRRNLHRWDNRDASTPTTDTNNTIKNDNAACIANIFGSDSANTDALSNMIEVERKKLGMSSCTDTWIRPKGESKREKVRDSKMYEDDRHTDAVEDAVVADAVDDDDDDDVL